MKWILLTWVINLILFLLTKFFAVLMGADNTSWRFVKMTYAIVMILGHLWLIDIPISIIVTIYQIIKM